MAPWRKLLVKRSTTKMITAMNPLPALKFVYDLGKDFLHWRSARRRRKASEPDAVSKDLILTELRTRTLQNNGNVYGPTPGTKEHSLCMELAREGYLQIVFRGFALPGTFRMSVFG
jgi:hypothetical protein